MTKIISSSYGLNSNRQLEVSEDGGINFVIRDNGTAVIGITVSPYDLHEALGFDGPKRAEEAAMGREAWKAKWDIEHARAEAFEQTARDLRTELDAANARAEDAEAKLADAWYEGVAYGQFHDDACATDNPYCPKPAFTLPTAAGARFTAQGKYDAIGQRTTFITLVGGREPAYVVADKEEDILYHAHGVMEHYEDHRHEEAK